MVIFHSYVSLPEGTLQFSDMAKENPPVIVDVPNLNPSFR